MQKLDDRAYVAQYDIEQMMSVLDCFSHQCQEAIALGEQFELLAIDRIDKVIVCGMGGSAMAGEFARRFARIPCVVNRSYALPALANSRTLLVAVSYSGNTEEVLSSLEQGIKKGIPTLCISSGGALEEASKKSGLPFLKIPSGLQPRAALGYLTLPLLVTLSQVEVLNEIGPWENLLQSLELIKTRCCFDAPTPENPAKQLAYSLVGKIPLIYGTSDNTDLVAMRWKTQINENAKQAAYWNAFPELNHNEIMALEAPAVMSDHFVVFLRNTYDREENIARMKIMEDLLRERSIPFTGISVEGESELAQLFSQVYLGDYFSFYLALLNKTDPTPVHLIEQFKKALAERTNGHGGQAQ